MASITQRGKGPFTKALIGPVYLNDIWLGVQPPLPPSMEFFSLLNNLLVNLPFSSWMCWNESTHSWWEEEIIRVTRNSWPISNWMWPPCVCVWGRGRIGVVLCERETRLTTKMNTWPCLHYEQVVKTKLGKGVQGWCWQPFPLANRPYLYTLIYKFAKFSYL